MGHHYLDSIANIFLDYQITTPLSYSLLLRFPEIFEDDGWMIRGLGWSGTPIVSKSVSEALIMELY